MSFSWFNRQETYNRLFNMLQNNFLSIFPPPNSGVDDVYVWQFLASMAVGAVSEQQHILVTEVRYDDMVVGYSFLKTEVRYFKILFSQNRDRVIEMLIQANSAP